MHVESLLPPLAGRSFPLLPLGLYVDGLFSWLWAAFACLFAYLEIFDQMLTLLIFMLLGAGPCC